MYTSDSHCSLNKGVRRFTCEHMAVALKIECICMCVHISVYNNLMYWEVIICPHT